MIRKLTIWSGLAIISSGLLTACGSSQPGRTSGGVATGAGTGAAIGIIGGPIGIVVGAAVGAGAGALTATNTTPQQVDLGEPLWVHPQGATAGPAPAVGGNYGSMPPPQPLSQSAYAVPGQPSPGAAAMPESAPIESQSLPAAQASPQAGGYQQPTPLTPPAQYQAQ